MNKIFQLALISVVLISCSKPDFSGDYTFYLGQKAIVKNTYLKAKKDKIFGLSDNWAHIIRLAPFKIKIGKNKDTYTGRAIWLSLQRPGLFEVENDTTEITCSLTEFISSGDTLNFMFSRENGFGGQSSVRGVLIKSKNDVLVGVTKEFVDRLPCYESSPFFVKNEDQMFYFKEPKMTVEESSKEMQKSYRACLGELVEKDKTNEKLTRAIGYLDSLAAHK